MSRPARFAPSGASGILLPAWMHKPYPYQGTGKVGWLQAVAALSGVWAWWKLDETPGISTTYADSSGNGRTLQSGNTGLSSVAGLIANYVDTAIQRANNGTFLNNLSSPATPITGSADVEIICVFEQQSVGAGNDVAVAFGGTGAHQSLSLALESRIPVAVSNGGDLGTGVALTLGTKHLAIIKYKASNTTLTLIIDNVTTGPSTITALNIPAGQQSFIFNPPFSVGGWGGLNGIVDDTLFLTTLTNSTQDTNLYKAFAGL